MSSTTRAISQEFPATKPISADISLGSGSIAVTADDQPYVSVTVDPSDNSQASRDAAQATKISFAEDQLRIEAPHGNRGFRRSGSVRVEVRLPLDSRLRSRTGSADIRTEGRLAEADIHTGSGDVYVRQVTGLFSAETGSGDVFADEAGELHASTASGDVTCTAVTNASVKTASGDVDIEEARGSIRLNTASGDASIRAARGDSVNIHTASGDVRVGVPAGTRVWLDLSTMSGSTTSDLAMSDGSDVAGQSAQLNVEVRTASGDITLRRVPASAA